MPVKPDPLDRVIEKAKAMLIESAQDKEGAGEWREGYEDALVSLLSNFGIAALPVPATYSFEAS